jgi:hypothetical protein
MKKQSLSPYVFYHILRQIYALYDLWSHLLFGLGVR